MACQASCAWQPQNNRLPKHAATGAHTPTYANKSLSAGRVVAVTTSNQQHAEPSTLNLKQGAHEAQTPTGVLLQASPLAAPADLPNV